MKATAIKGTITLTDGSTAEFRIGTDGVWSWWGDDESPGAGLVVAALGVMARGLEEEGLLVSDGAPEPNEGSDERDPEEVPRSLSGPQWGPQWDGDGYEIGPGDPDYVSPARELIDADPTAEEERGYLHGLTTAFQSALHALDDTSGLVVDTEDLEWFQGKIRAAAASYAIVLNGPAEEGDPEPAPDVDPADIRSDFYR